MTNPININDYTAAQKAVLLCWSFNYDNSEDEKSDSCSPMHTKNFVNVLQMNRKQAGGVMSGLVKRGLMFENNPDEFFLTDEGIDVSFAFKELTGMPTYLPGM